MCDQKLKFKGEVLLEPLRAGQRSLAPPSGPNSNVTQKREEFYIPIRLELETVLSGI